MAETEGIYRASDGREVDRDVRSGSCRCGRCRRISLTGSAGLGSRLELKGRYAPVTRPDLDLLTLI